MEAASRILGKQVVKKDPLTISYIEQLWKKANFKKPSDLRDLFNLVVSFEGCLRVSETIAIQRKHVTEFPDRFEIFLVKRKNDPKKEGHTVCFKIVRDPRVKNAA